MTEPEGVRLLLRSRVRVGPLLGPVFCLLFASVLAEPAFSEGQAVLKPGASSSPGFGVQDRARLRKSFVRALSNETRALQQRNRAEMADLKASQKARRRELNTERREFFNENPEPAKRRAYMKELVARRRALDQLLAAELKGRKSDQRAAEKSLREEQKRRLSEFDAALKAGERPSDLLWTPLGR